MGTKVAIISGATKGLGRSLAIKFACQGSFVVGIYKSDSETALELSATLSELGGAFELLQLDVTEDLAVLLNNPIIQQSELIVVVNNVGPVFEPKPLHLYGPKEIEQLLRDTVYGAVNMTTTLLPLLLKKRGSTIVNVSSSAVATNPKGFSAYSMGKAALNSYTRSLASEYSNRGLRVFSVSPDFMSTPGTGKWHESMRTAIVSAQGGSLSPETVAERTVSLVADSETPARGEDYLISGTCVAPSN